MNQKFLLIGHRGAGKSSFLSRLAKSGQFSDWQFLSLDDEIESRSGQTIPAIFAKQGEAEFRRMEKEILKQLVDQWRDRPHVIDLGAGYQGQKPPGYRAIWLRRSINLQKSQFTNRPPLDGGLQVSVQRFASREKTYEQMADLQWELREGEELGEGDLRFFSWLAGRSSLQLKGAWHQTPLNDREAERLLSGSRPPWRLEWRDDLISEPILHQALERGWVDLLSFRREPGKLSNLQHTKAARWDWPLEWGPHSEAPWLSLHVRRDSLQQTLQSLPSLREGQKIKAALPITDFRELRQLHEWQQEDPQFRVALPMSPEGRWRWYRILMGEKSPLAFFTFAQGWAADQPSLNQLLNQPRDVDSFAAVLGSPVRHSQTPVFHAEFFRKRRKSVFAIDLKPAEFADAIPFLQSLGLTHAAVTSPLKELAAQLAGQSGSLNTLVFGSNIEGINTDQIAYQKLLAQAAEPIAIWGGGGVLAPLRVLRKDVPCYSSRTGELKSGFPQDDPQSLIWAVGPEAFAQQGCWPPEQWRPKKVFDLNYTSDSPAIAWAHQQGIAYQSGLSFFRDQALAQQRYWEGLEIQSR